ncbi:MAG: signal recognition particle-docking protein FtsY [Candidatus Binatia bacterium]
MPWSPDTLLYLTAIAGGVAAAVALYCLFRRRRSATPQASPAAVSSPTPAEVFRESLTATRQGLLARLQDAWSGAKDVEARFAELEEVLITADVGFKATQLLLDRLRSRARELADPDALREALREQMRVVLADREPAVPAAAPHVILVAGVNGVGKTTTIGKLAYRYRQGGQKVLLIAADTFRAAASEQLEHWAQRAGASCVRHQSGSDPSAVVYDGLKAAVARGTDIVIVDTAGRLHVKTNLIEELKKVARVIGRQVAGAPHEALLVIDATTGQNAIRQALVFRDALPLTGVVLTKLDGTAKGGAVFAVRAESGLPIRYVGFGESLNDLAPFDPDAFLNALLPPARTDPSRQTEQRTSAA